MSTGLNDCNFIGYLAATPAVSYTQTGKAVLRFRIGCSESFRDQEGHFQQRTEWISAVVWNKRAEGLGKFLRKGLRVFVKGKLVTSSWVNQKGNPQNRTEVKASQVIVLTPKQTVDQSTADDSNDEEIPF